MSITVAGFPAECQNLWEPEYIAVYGGGNDNWTDWEIVFWKAVVFYLVQIFWARQICTYRTLLPRAAFVLVMETFAKLFNATHFENCRHAWVFWIRFQNAISLTVMPVYILNVYAHGNQVAIFRYMTMHRKRFSIKYWQRWLNGFSTAFSFSKFDSDYRVSSLS